MNRAILNLYDQNDSIQNLYVSISNKEIINFQQKKASNLINIRSMTKSIVSLLIGISLKENYIKSLDTPINCYLPEAPKHIVIRELLTMSSGSIF